jgi:(1->4)-alpha-D-glucan 1-alpha-D-glucosylmutase
VKIPVATYRLQFHSGFRLQDALELVDYLQELGISDLYASPICKARSGSTHGYDVTDPSRLNPEIGTDDDFHKLTQRLHENGMGLLLDIVPNHMAASEENPWWRSVLERGQSSPYANYFDVDWSSASGYMQYKILLPLLGDLFGKVLERGELKLSLEGGHLQINYYDRKFPLKLQSYPRILEYLYPEFVEEYGATHSAVVELTEIIQAFQSLPLDHETVRNEHQSELDPIGSAKRRLYQAVENFPEIREYLVRVFRKINGKPGKSETYNFLEKTLHEQAYRLSFWRISDEEINYRRFFNISDLISMRVENESVFDDMHQLILSWIREGRVTGLRIDHVDGLYDPIGYLVRLQEKIALQRSEVLEEQTPFYVVVEKILSEEEALPSTFPVCGTSGYDFLNYTHGVFIDQAGLASLEEIYTWIIGEKQVFEDLVYEKKKLVMHRLFAGEVRRLHHRLVQIARDDRHARDLSSSQLLRALVEVTACLPVYRNYARECIASPRDQHYVNVAIREARRRVAGLSSLALNFLRRLLCMEFPESLSVDRRVVWHDFIMRWQQFSGPMMAKGFEDTALYLYNRLVSLNDVGGEPDAVNLTLERFHQSNQLRQEEWRHSMNTTSTHDTKRGEDVRSRLHVLSEMPDVFLIHVKRWFELNQEKKQMVRRMMVPSANEEYLLYQTILGFWDVENRYIPEFVERLKQYMIKAIREAKIYTNWMRPDEKHETALTRFIDRIFEHPEQNEFYKDLSIFLRKIQFYGMINSLSQVMLKVTSPGVPDFYQGTELWDLNLVDPDNRRPVDFQKRRRWLQEIRERDRTHPIPLLTELLQNWKDGRIKLWLIYKLLHIRHQYLDLFQLGDYLPLQTEGTHASHVCAFVRRSLEKQMIVVIPRLLSKIVEPDQLPCQEKIWKDTVLLLPAESKTEWLNTLTQEPVSARQQNGQKTLPIHQVFTTAPVALLISA